MKNPLKSIERYFSYVRQALWTIITLAERIDSLETQIKISGTVKDKLFSFFYQDIEVTLYLPLIRYDFIQNTIVASGTFYEAPLLRKVSKYIKENAHVADCGCNIGNHSVFFAKICNAAHVTSFDPQYICAQACKRNMELNGVAEKSTVIQKAIGKCNGFMRRSQDVPGNCGATRFTQDTSGTIPMITIDSLNFTQLDFMKIDVEGGQLDLLQGASTTLEKFHPTIWIELLSDDGRADYDHAKEITLPFKFLEDRGYSMVEKIGDDNYIFRYADN